MFSHNYAGLAGYLQGQNTYQYHFVSIRDAELPRLVISETNTAQEDYRKQLILLLNLTHLYNEDDYTSPILSRDSDNIGTIVVRAIKKRVLASIEVDLSPKDFKKRLPKPTIQVEPEVEL